jgi:hypothetical protein
LPNKRIDLFAFVPICPIREKLPDRDQKETGSRLQFQYVFSHPRPTSSTLMRRVAGRGFLMYQQKDPDKNSLHTFLPTSLITSLPLRSLSQITRSHSLKTAAWKRKKENTRPFFSFK